MITITAIITLDLSLWPRKIHITFRTFVLVLDLWPNVEMTSAVKFAIIIVASVPVLCIYPFVQKHFIKGVMIGSLKG